MSLLARLIPHFFSPLQQDIHAARQVQAPFLLQYFMTAILTGAVQVKLLSFNSVPAIKRCQEYQAIYWKIK